MLLLLSGANIADTSIASVSVKKKQSMNDLECRDAYSVGHSAKHLNIQMQISFLVPAGTG